MFRVDDPRSEPRVFHKLTQKKWRKTRGAILLFVLSTKTTKERFLLKLYMRVSETEIKKESPLLSCIELTVQHGNP